MTAEGLTRETCQQRREGFHGEATGDRSAPALTEPASSNQSRALIKSILNCLCDSSNSGLEELLRERPERLAEPNAPPQGASVKERELPLLSIARHERKSLVKTQKMQASLETKYI